MDKSYKRILSIFLSVLMLCSLCMPAFAYTPELEEAVPTKIKSANAREAEYVYDWQTLLGAVEDTVVSEIRVGADIVMQDSLVIRKNLLIMSADGETYTLFSSNECRHFEFELEEEQEVLLAFENIDLDGRDLGGGISKDTEAGIAVIDGANIVNCGWQGYDENMWPFFNYPVEGTEISVKNSIFSNCDYGVRLKGENTLIENCDLIREDETYGQQGILLADNATVKKINIYGYMNPITAEGTGIKITESKVSGSNRGISISGNKKTGNAGVEISNCIFEDISGTAVYTDGGTSEHFEVKIVDSEFVGRKYRDTFAYGSIMAETWAGNLIMENCDISGFKGGLKIYESAHISNSKIHDCIDFGLLHQGSELEIIDSEIYGNGIYEYEHSRPDGGIEIVEGAFGEERKTTIKNTKIYSNKSYSSGAGIKVKEGNHPLNIIDCEIYENETENDGGGIYLLGADKNSQMKIEGTRIENNKAAGNGGGIWFENPSISEDKLEIFTSNIYQNEAKNGAGIYTNGSVIIEDTSIASNRAEGAGGAIYALFLEKLLLGPYTFFEDNSSSEDFEASEELIAEYPNIEFCNTSIHAHALNGYDIDYMSEMVMKKVQSVDWKSVWVRYGTPEEELGLPSLIEVTFEPEDMEEGQYQQGTYKRYMQVEWDTSEYDPTLYGYGNIQYIYGTLVMDVDTENPNEKKAQLSLRVDDPECIYNVEELGDVHVLNGTSEEALNGMLPVELEIKTSYGNKMMLPVIWNFDEAKYDGNYSGTYTIYGDLQIPEDMELENKYDYRASINVTVSRKMIETYSWEEFKEAVEDDTIDEIRLGENLEMQETLVRTRSVDIITEDGEDYTLSSAGAIKHFEIQAQEDEIVTMSFEGIILDAQGGHGGFMKEVESGKAVIRNVKIVGVQIGYTIDGTNMSVHNADLVDCSNSIYITSTVSSDVTVIENTNISGIGMSGEGYGGIGIGIVDNMLIKGCKITNYTSALDGYGVNVKVENTEINGNSDYGGWFYEGWANGTDIAFANCDIYDNGTGIGADGRPSITFNNCNFYDNDSAVVYYAEEFEFNNCKIYNNKTGITAYSPLKISNSKIYENEEYGVEACDDLIMTSCDVISNGFSEREYVRVSGGIVIGDTGYGPENKVAIINHSNIYRNKSDSTGGGININDTKRSVYLTNTEVVGNTAEIGGGIYTNTKLLVTGGIITENFASNKGGGIYTTAIDELTTINGVDFACNTATQLFEANDNIIGQYPNIDFIGTSIYSHALNGYDIDFTPEEWDMKWVDDYEMLTHDREYGVQEEELNLPKKIKVELASNNYHSYTRYMGVNWDTSTFDPEVYNRNQTIIGELILESDTFADPPQFVECAVYLDRTDFIIGADTPNDIEVLYGTSVEGMEDILSTAHEKVKADFYPNGSGMLDVKWDVEGSDFDGEISGVYKIYGDFVIPDGSKISNPENIRTEISVRVLEAPILKNVSEIEGAAVDAGQGILLEQIEKEHLTSPNGQATVANLPKTVKVKFSEGGEADVPVTWSTENYNPWLTEGTQTVYGAIELKDTGIGNPMELVPELVVTVVPRDYYITAVLPNKLSVEVYPGASLEDAYEAMLKEGNGELDIRVIDMKDMQIKYLFTPFELEDEKGNYENMAPGKYEVSVKLPDRLTPAVVMPKVTVFVLDPLEVTAITNPVIENVPQSVEPENLADGMIPLQVEVELDNGKTEWLDVEWTWQNAEGTKYDKDVVGTQFIVGEFINIPSKIKEPIEFTPVMALSVEPVEYEIISMVDFPMINADAGYELSELTSNLEVDAFTYKIKSITEGFDITTEYKASFTIEEERNLGYNPALSTQYIYITPDFKGDNVNRNAAFEAVGLKLYNWNIVSSEEIYTAADEGTPFEEIEARDTVKQVYAKLQSTLNPNVYKDDVPLNVKWDENDYRAYPEELTDDEPLVQTIYGEFVDAPRYINLVGNYVPPVLKVTTTRAFTLEAISPVRIPEVGYMAVDLGLTTEEIYQQLPTKEVELTIRSTNGVVSVITTTFELEDCSYYDPYSDETGKYEFKAYFPIGNNRNPDNLELSVFIETKKYAISSGVASMVNAVVGEEFEDIVPQTSSAILSDGRSIDIPVIWDTLDLMGMAYDSSTAGLQIFNGTYDYSSMPHVYNPNNLDTSVMIFKALGRDSKVLSIEQMETDIGSRNAMKLNELGYKEVRYAVEIENADGTVETEIISNTVELK